MASIANQHAIAINLCHYSDECFCEEASACAAEASLAFASASVVFDREASLASDGPSELEGRSVSS